MNRPLDGSKWRWSGGLLLAILTVLLLAPFAGKAVHVDDALFVWTAEQILEDPLDFYGFDVNWYFKSEPMHGVTKNPPLTSYLLALAGGVLGFGEIGLHLVLLLPALGVVVGTWKLARRWTDRPEIAAGATLLSPVFLVSSTNLMSDTSMLCLWIWAVVLWTSGIEGRSVLRLLAAGVLISAAVLTKYFAIALLPLLAVHGAWRTKRAGIWLAALTIPVLTLVGYELWTQQAYGVGMLSSATSYAVDSRAGAAPGWALKLLTALAFTGGCSAPMLFCLQRIGSRRQLVIAAGLSLLLTGAIGVLGSTNILGLYSDGRANWGFVAQLALWSVLGVIALTLTVGDLRRRCDPDALILALWVLGTFVFAAFVNWTINGRSMLPLVPALGIVLARRLDQLERCGVSANKGGSHRESWSAWIVPATLATILGIGVTWADYSLANAGRSAARRIVSTYGERPLLFQGHWGFQYYMQRAGAKPLEYDNVRLSPGDLVVVPSNTTNILPMPEGYSRLAESIELPVSRFASTIRAETGAGFYSDRWGPLPFVLGRSRSERYDVMEMTRALRSEE